jgi:MFS family permease
MASAPPAGRSVPRNVLLLGVTSFFADVASDMVVPLLPSFIVSLGGGAAFIGAVEGTAEAAASLLKFISGRWADKARRLLPLAVSGYAVAGAVRPLLAFAAAPWQVLALRCGDRVGKGLRTSPRDKLLAASAPPGRLAEAFSFHRGMDHLGAALGPLCATGLLAIWPGQLRRVFLVAAVPGALAVLAILCVREHERDGSAAPDERAKGPPPDGIRQGAATGGPAGAEGERVPRALIAAIGLFALGNSSDALLLLRAQDLGFPLAQLPLLWTLLHVVRASASWPLGRLADRTGRRGALAAGWLWYALCYLAFARADRAWQMWALFAAYGLVAALTEGSERALVAAAVPAARRGTALGAYYLVSGAGLLVASVLAGVLWERVSPAAALGAGALLAALAATSLAFGSSQPAERRGG